MYLPNPHLWAESETLLNTGKDCLLSALCVYLRGHNVIVHCNLNIHLQNCSTEVRNKNTIIEPF